VFSAASLPAEQRARLCIAGSFSKTYAMTGWRMGYALAPADWTKAMLKVQSHSTSNPNSIAQRAAIEALTGPQESVAEMLAEYTARREWLLEAVKDVPGFSCSTPEGAFYAFPKVTGCLNGKTKTAADFADRLLSEEKTVVTEGASFGAEGYIRMSYATSMDQLAEGVLRIKRFAKRLIGEAD
jgi:aspartate aminotransferase